MKMRMVKGMAAALCMAMLATTAAAVAPGGAMVASAEEPGNNSGGNNTGGDSNTSGGNNNNTSSGSNNNGNSNNGSNGTGSVASKDDQMKFVGELQALLVNKKLNAQDQKNVDDILSSIYKQIGYDSTKSATDKESYDDSELLYPVLKTYVDSAKEQISKIVNPSIEGGTAYDGGDDDDEDADNNDEDPPVNPDHFLMVGGSWVTPVANAGQTISVVLPVVNMGKTMVTDAVVTPVLSTF